MNKWWRGSRLLYTCFFAVLVVSGSIPTFGQGSKMPSSTAPIQDEDQDNPGAREQWFRKGREPLPGRTAAEMRYSAHRQKMQLRSMRARASRARASNATALAASNSWTALGPAPFASDAGTGQDYGLVTGRVNAVAIDPADPTGNTVYAGGAFGGLWRSRNATAVPASAVTWTALTDDQPTLSFGAIAIQPGNATGNLSNVIVVGTGEANAAIDSYYGLGFLRSADGGNTWTLISTSDNGSLSLVGLAVSRMAFGTGALGNTLVAGVATSPIGVENGADTANSTRGIYTSKDAGVTWTHEIPSDNGALILSTSATSVVYNAGAGRFFAAIRYHGFYSSTDGITWTRLTSQPGSGLTTAACPANPYSTGCPILRGELAVVPGRNEMYAWYVDSNIADQGIYRTTNSGVSWTKIDETGLSTACTESGCGTTQAFFNMSLAAVPDGTTTDLYAGAVNEFKCPKLAPASSACNGSTWLNLTHVYNCSSVARVHPDEHAIDSSVLNGKNLLFFGNDGGVYRALDGFTGLNTGTCAGSNAFDDLNATLGSLSQFVSFSQHPSSTATILGGTQDNGSPATNQGTTSLSWINVNAGDGGYNEINPANPNEWFTANTDVSVQRCLSGINCTAPTFPYVVRSANVGGDHGEFYTPYILDPQSSTSELLIGTCRVWRGPGTGGTFSALSFNFETGTASSCTGNETNLVRSIAAGGPTSGGFSNVMYATTEGFGPLSPTSPAGGRVFRTMNAAGPTSTWADMTQNINSSQYTVSSVAIDTSDGTGQTAYVALMGFGASHVFKTTNGGTSWVDFSGSGIGTLPNAPANSLVIDAAGGNIYVGTDVGVFGSTTGSANWVEVGPAAAPGNAGFLPNVPVTKLRLFNSGGQKLLRASTYGRGVWQYPLVIIPDYTIGLASLTQTVFPAQQANFAGILTALNSYASSVGLSCTAGTSAPPTTCSLSPNSITPLPAGANFSLTAANNAVGDFNFNVHGVGTDTSTTTHDQPVTLHVADYTVSAPNPGSITVNIGQTSGPIGLQVNLAGTWSQGTSITMACSNPPTGVTCNFSPATVLPSMGTIVPVSLTFTTGASAQASSSQVFITATPSFGTKVVQQSVALTLTAFPDFNMALSPSSSTAVPIAQQITVNGTATAFSGYNSAVNLSCTNGSSAPPATCNLSPASVTPTGSGVAFSLTASSSATGVYSFNVHGSGTDASNVTHDAPVVMTFYDFSVTQSGPQTVTAGGIASYTLTVAPDPAPNLQAPVTFSCSGLPSLTNCSFNPNQLTGSQTQTILSISTTRPISTRPRSIASLWLIFPAAGLAFVGLFRKRHTASAWLLVLLIAVGMQVACGGGSAGGGGGGITNPGTPPGSYTVNVTVVEGTTGSQVSHVVPVSLTVQ